MAIEYTPIFEDIAQAHGLPAAAVYGAVWRAQKLSRGKCDKSSNTIGEEIGMSGRNVTRWLDYLVEKKLIKPTERKGRTTEYETVTPDSLSAVSEVVPLTNLYPTPDKFVETPDKFVETPDSLSAEETKDTKETIKNGDSGGVFSAYENNIQMLTPMTVDKLTDLITEYTAGWVTDAIRIAAENNKRNLPYIGGILKRWKRDGRGDLPSASKPKPAARVLVPVGAKVESLTKGQDK